MLNFLIRFSLAQRALILVLALVTLGLGLKSGTELPVEVLPDLTKPTVTILTEAPGLAPEEVERRITIPLESALMGVTGMTRLRSVNDISLSLIFVEFDWGTDIYQARQFVQERLAGARDSIPPGVSPYLTPAASLMGNIMLVGLMDPTGETTPSELRTIADWEVARKIQSIAGIAEVLSMGGGVKQVQVQPNPNAMLALDVSFEQIRHAAANAVKNTTGGFLTESTQEIMVRNLAMTSDLDAIGNTVVAQENDRAIRLKDVAKVVWGIEPMRGDAGLGTKAGGNAEGNAEVNAEGDAGATRGYRGVILSITKSPGFDTIELTEKVREALEEMQETLPEGARLVTLYDQSEFIDLAVGNLEEALFLGAIMVSLVLLLFLFNFRVTAITLAAIPLSLGVSVIVFDLFNLSVNSMTLGGLAVAIGMVVDDAIVDVENVFRRLRENASLTVPRSRLEVIAAASREVRSSILYATLLIIFVFLPLLGLTGVEGRLFAPIAIATIVSMAASFVVSLTVIPVLSYYLLKPEAGHEHRDGWFVRGLKNIFGLTLLRLAIGQPALVIALTLGALAYTVHVYTEMGERFLPAFREPTAVIATTTAPGTSLKQTTEVADTAQDLLLKIPEVETVGYRVGRAERGDHVVPVSTVEFDVEFDESKGRSRKEILDDMRQTMNEIKGTFSVISGPLADRIGHMLSGVSAKVAIKVYGPDLVELRRIGTEIAEIAREIPGLEEARVEQQAPIPQLRNEIDDERASVYNTTPGAIADQLASLMGGETVSEVYEGERVYDLVVRLPREWRESPERMEELYVDTGNGERIPLNYVAALRHAMGPNVIKRENTMRRFVVSVNPTTSDLSTAVEKLQAAVDSRVKLPRGYSISWEGDYKAQQEATEQILFLSAVIFLVVSFLLYSYFQSFTFVVLVLLNIPMSIIGGVILTHLKLDNVSIATLVGFIAISGIAARNSIMMISHYLHLMRHEGEGFTRAMIERGTQERLVPILMTALSAGIALLPLVIDMGFLPGVAGGDPAATPGKEILNPVAVVIVGGLLSSTLFGLVVTPAVFFAFGRKAAEHAIIKNAPATE